MKIETIGSVCSGIEAASVAWEQLGWKFEWFSEIAKFPSILLEEKFPSIPNVGDMCDIPEKIINEDLSAPDMVCGGTPCQAFSYAGWKNGLSDDRGNLTLRFVDIINSVDEIRTKEGKKPTVVFWENVEGVLTDKTNAFGLFVSSLAGLSEPLTEKKWANAGVIRGPIRNVAWRVLDAKYFGLPQQRKRVYLLAGGKDFSPEAVLFEYLEDGQLLDKDYPESSLKFNKDGIDFEIFREYTDCLYSSYGTKWNGNAAAYNGSLFVSQDNRLRRISPLEAERLMGFPDNYTNIKKSTRTTRYQALGNSWSVPVVRWIGERLKEYTNESLEFLKTGFVYEENEYDYFTLENDVELLASGKSINTSIVPNVSEIGTMKNIVDTSPPPEIFISPVGCAGILRRKEERNLNINTRLEELLTSISSEMHEDEILERSMVQKRGKFSQKITRDKSNVVKQ